MPVGSRLLVFIEVTPARLDAASPGEVSYSARAVVE
jgi:hypothetical protein